MSHAEFPSSAVFLLICASILFVLVALWWLGDWLQELGQAEFEEAAHSQSTPVSPHESIEAEKLTARGKGLRFGCEYMPPSREAAIRLRQCGFGPHCHRSKSCHDTDCQGHPASQS